LRDWFRSALPYAESSRERRPMLRELALRKHPDHDCNRELKKCDGQHQAMLTLEMHRIPSKPQRGPLSIVTRCPIRKNDKGRRGRPGFNYACVAAISVSWIEPAEDISLDQGLFDFRRPKRSFARFFIALLGATAES
jgi:hypothetical protein